MEKKENKMHLPSLDDIFTTQKERDEADLEKVVNISIKDIDDYPQHPFKVLVNDEMQEMVDSIKEKGVLVPTIVRQKADGRYEMISGHRRKKASELAELDTIPCIVRDLTDDEATIIMVDSNLQREKILPSEKAFAYKLKMDAISHQGKETSRPLVDKLKSVDIIAKDNNDSSRQVHRYIRLTELIPELLQMVDNDVLKETPSMAFRPAVEISYLTKDEQTALLDLIECYDCTPSLAQAIKLKNMSQNNTLTIDDMEEIMEESKPNQTPKLKVSMNRLNNILPNTLKNDREREEYVIKAVEWYDKYQKKMRERNSQER
ncbi:MAG: ParB/RepB/Spo0J family partition protein [Methanosphaera sp.]|nr:ParB/RepB/Spo0J family partition protein [Methanosphaera sp.]